VQRYRAAFSLRRALQRQAARRCRAATAASHARAGRGAATVREELGLTREAFEQAASRHLERSRHLAHHLSKALAMHSADAVWTAAARHLVPDARGQRAGPPSPGRWWTFQTLPGRACSHTIAHKWETFRLVGTLAGHLDRYRSPSLSAVATVGDAGGVPRGGSVLAQPRHLQAPTAPRSGSWWEHRGALAVVFAGGPAARAGDLVLPVRLPAGAGAWAHTAHHLTDPGAWHKLDLVRTRAPGQRGGWRYAAHLLVLAPPYVAPPTAARRAAAAQLDRRAGVDVNVSNVTVVSFAAAGTDGRRTVVTLDQGERQRLAAAADRARRQARALDRSRRATNRAQYAWSRAQERRAARRAAAGLRPVTVSLPRGPRRPTAAGVPEQAYRRDACSAAYRHGRARLSVAAAARTRASQARARQVAADLVATHGARAVVEAADVGVWARRWGRGVAAFTPGRLVRALAAEAAAVARLGAAPGLVRAATRPTACSQHCLCGARVPKTLADRVHRCPACGLTGDRDAVAAAVLAFVTVTDPADPGTARVDVPAARQALADCPGLHAVLSESRAAPLGRRRRRPGGWAPASARRRRAARRTAGSVRPTIPDEPPRPHHGPPETTPRASAGHAGRGRDPVHRQDFWPRA